MSAYMIFTRETTLDKTEMATYSQQAFATMQGHPGKLLAAYGPHEVLEGAATEGALILEFPTVGAAKAWYDSPAYRQVREHRFKGASALALVQRAGGVPWQQCFDLIRFRTIALASPNAALHHGQPLSMPASLHSSPSFLRA